MDSLYTYVKNDQATSFTVNEFIERHVPGQFKDKYQYFMDNRRFPSRAVRRDTTDLKGKLRRRRFKYSGDIEFSAAPESIAEGLVTIDTLAPTDEEPQETTKITIRTPFLKET